MTAMECPFCQARADVHDGLDPADAPSAGDVSVCYYCGCLSVYALVRVRPTAAELVEYLDREDVQAAIEAVTARNPSVTATVREWRASFPKGHPLNPNV